MVARLTNGAEAIGCVVVEQLDAGAHEAWTRRVSPDVVTDGLLGLLQAELQHS